MPRGAENDASGIGERHVGDVSDGNSGGQCHCILGGIGEHAPRLYFPEGHLPDGGILGGAVGVHGAEAVVAGADQRVPIGPLVVLLGLGVARCGMLTDGRELPPVGGTLDIEVIDLGFGVGCPVQQDVVLAGRGGEVR